MRPGDRRVRSRIAGVLYSRPRSWRCMTDAFPLLWRPRYAYTLVWLTLEGPNETEHEGFGAVSCPLRSDHPNLEAQTPACPPRTGERAAKIWQGQDQVCLTSLPSPPVQDVYLCPSYRDLISRSRRPRKPGQACFWCGSLTLVSCQHTTARDRHLPINDV